MAVVFSILFLILVSAFDCSTGSTAVIGINYGQVADNLPPPDAVIPLLHSLGAAHVKLYDSDPKVLRAFSGSDLEFVVGLPDGSVPRIASSPSAAQSWVDDNLRPYLPKTKISAVTVGNEVLSSNNTALVQSLVPAMASLHSALSSLGFDGVHVTTAHSLSVLSVSYPPSAGAFRKDLLPYITPLLAFLNKTGSPFLINAYPFFAYKADPKKVALDYVLFEPNSGVVDSGSGLKYDNMLHAQVDAVRAAIAAAGAKGVEVRVSETGWPSRGDEDEYGATPENAAKYNGNLMKMVAQGKGTPMCPGSPLSVYVFALFNENLKPGPASERHYGLFNPDGTAAYDVGVVKSGAGNSSAGGSAANSTDQPRTNDAVSPDGFYTISAAPERGFGFWSGRAVAAAAATVTVIAVVSLL
ncbi:putative glucan endo-1,3-beta-glucosidase 14 [Iris pallida]|uniref:glucan endo-1,3-beta-D-glucosidase n=1 Tax=Iris pallida TaxID=29817 RepID=A0AAX6ETV0_IRIPA|nr:putative glucan endo-1,3-beta-glucosidase 14 [Iris pallida]KAJ6851204.1 putative glucan endo-1,3-beta-glucosidase 14 [Iris pallida]